VEQNMKAVAFLMAAIPDLQIINVMAAGISDPDWPNEPKAHLMMAYLKETNVEATTLSRLGARCDLENCTLKKDENPKVQAYDGAYSFYQPLGNALEKQISLARYSSS
jgi:hypothetical protein